MNATWRKMMSRLIRGITLGILLLAGYAARADSIDSILQMCIVTSDEGLCEATKEQFRADWPAAHSGAYQAQRNVAFCLSTGCDGAIGVDPEGGCAWRMVIVASDDPSVDSGDVTNLQNECGRLAKKGRANAVVQAKRLFKQIYKKSMPAL